MVLKPTDHYLDYRGVAVCNRDVFLVNYPFVVTAFVRIDQALWPLIRTHFISWKVAPRAKASGSMAQSRRRSEAISVRVPRQNLRSDTLPRSEAIQTVLRRVNDAFLHPNPTYFRKHLDFVPIGDDHLGMQLNYFDSEESTQAHSLAILHLLVLLQDSVLTMYKPLFASLSTDSGLDVFEAEFRPRVQELISAYPDQRLVIEELGLWSL